LFSKVSRSHGRGSQPAAHPRNIVVIGRTELGREDRDRRKKHRPGADPDGDAERNARGFPQELSGLRARPTLARNRVEAHRPGGWKNFVARDKDRIKELRAQIRTLATDTGLDIGEFCKVVHTTPWDIAPTAPRE
jgi:hypothetical protein